MRRGTMGGGGVENDMKKKGLMVESVVSDLWGLTGRWRVSSVMAFRIAVAMLPGCRESSGHVAAAARLYELAHRTRRAFIVEEVYICKRSVRSIYRRWPTVSSTPLRAAARFTNRAPPTDQISRWRKFSFPTLAPLSFDSFYF